MSDKQEHLPLFGVGPLYFAAVAAITAAAFFCRNMEIFASGRMAALQMPMRIIGIILIVIAVWIWIQAVFVSKVDDSILKNQLVTDGIYAWVRNPIYTAIMIGCTGILFLTGNLYFLILPFVYWLFMTLLMKNTEEVWLKEKYGREYTDYCRRVNRCWPWFPGKQIHDLT